MQTAAGDLPVEMPVGVSVIVAAYNVEAYIERAIRSALDQEGVTVEVIVVNDASKDATAAVVSGIGDSRIKFIDQPKNGGASVARNTGLEAASLPWIAILDGDDALLPGRLLGLVKRATDTSADIVVDNLMTRREEDGVEAPMYPPAWFADLGTIDLTCFIDNNRTILGGRSLGYVKPFMSAAFVRQHNLRYDPNIRIIEDYFLMAEALINGAKCVVEPAAGYSYTVRKGSISHRLKLSDISHFMECDKQFLARHTLPAEAAQAQKLRDEDYERAYAFMQLIEALKSRNIMEALSIAVSDPVAASNLWRPVAARVQRAFGART